jgi:microcystin-dependent protein
MPIRPSLSTRIIAHRALVPTEGRHRMAEPFVGQVIAVGFNFAPVGWLPCNGQLLAISQYDVLFALLGTTYGGDGQTNFAVPDLQGRTPLSFGTGPALSNYVLGQKTGTESVTLLANQVGSHTHGLLASSQTGTIAKPTSNTTLSVSGQSLVSVYSPAAPSTTLSSKAIGLSTGGQPHENRQPFVTLNYIICYAGIFPSSS